DAQKYAYSLGPNRITNYASGPRALSYGIRYFFLNPKDAVARYGVMTPDLEAWIRTNGVRVAAYPSEPRWDAELWYVPNRPFDPADALPIPGGSFVNVVGSACGGYTVVNAVKVPMYQEYLSLGGKAVLGPPLGNAWRVGPSTLH